MDARFRDRVRKDRAQEILVAAMDALSSAGYDGFRVEEVARRVGVAKGTIYLDFPSREALAGAAVKHAGEQLVATVSEAIAAIGDPGERLIAVVHTAARTLVEHPELAIAVECRPIFGPLEGPDQPCEAYRKVLENMIDEARRAGTFARADKAVTAETLLGLLSRPAWRTHAAEVGVEEALQRGGIGEILSGVRG